MPITKGTELVTEVFGGVIDDDSAGFYTALEFFGILGGSLNAGNPLLPSEGDLETKSNGADFADATPGLRRKLKIKNFVWQGRNRYFREPLRIWMIPCIYHCVV